MEARPAEARVKDFDQFRAGAHPRAGRGRGRSLPQLRGVLRVLPVRGRRPHGLEVGAGLDDNNFTNSTNAVWLFGPADVTAPLDTSGYDWSLGRLRFTESLVDGANVLDLFNTLPQTILRVEVLSVEDIDAALLNSTPVDYTIELVAFTNLPNGMIFSDQDQLEHIRSLTVKMGGQAYAGDIIIDTWSIRRMALTSTTSCSRP